MESCYYQVYQKEIIVMLMNIIMLKRSIFIVESYASIYCHNIVSIFMKY